MNDKIRIVAGIGMMLIVFAFIATPVAAATMSQVGGSDNRAAGWNTASYRPYNPTFSWNTAPTASFNYATSQNKYANLNNLQSTGSPSVNKVFITIPTMTAMSTNWDSLFTAPSFLYSCGCS